MTGGNSGDAAAGTKTVKPSIPVAMKTASQWKALVTPSSPRMAR